MIISTLLQIAGYKRNQTHKLQKLGLTADTSIDTSVNNFLTIHFAKVNKWYKDNCQSIGGYRSFLLSNFQNEIQLPSQSDDLQSTDRDVLCDTQQSQARSEKTGESALTINVEEKGLYLDDSTARVKGILQTLENSRKQNQGTDSESRRQLPNPFVNFVSRENEYRRVIDGLVGANRELGGANRELVGANRELVGTNRAAIAGGRRLAEITTIALGITASTHGVDVGTFDSRSSATALRLSDEQTIDVKSELVQEYLPL